MMTRTRSAFSGEAQAAVAARTQGAVGATLCALLLTGCQQQMAGQPSYRPLDPSAFFGDGLSARPLVAGTVARGHLADELSTFAKIDGRNLTVADYVNTFPVPVTHELLERGRERYSIFCSVCHGATGQGDGKIVERGYTPPPSLVVDWSRGFKHRGTEVPLRDAPPGYYFEVITQGYGAMPDYASQVPPRDRWAIIAFIRALQSSQHAKLTDLPEAERRAAESALEAKP